MIWSDCDGKWIMVDKSLKAVARSSTMFSLALIESKEMVVKVLYVVAMTTAEGGC